jgi:predicted dehydrogenase
VSHTRIVNVGVIGCGQLARSVQLRILANMRDVRVTAVAEPDPALRDAASRLVPDAQTFATYQQLLALDSVDAVILALPNDRHAEAAVSAFATGKHVYLEKPLATSRRDGEDVLRAWERSGRVGMIGFNYRFNKLYGRARALIRAGALGELVAVRSVFAMAARPLPVWKQRRVSGGGALLDLGSHHLDLVRFLLDTEVIDVTCDVQSRSSESDSAFVRLTLANGATAQMFFSLCAADEDQFEIYGTAGKIRIDRCHAMDVQLRGAAGEAYRADQMRYWLASLQNLGYGFARQRAFGHEPSWQIALEQFIGAVRGQRPAKPDLYDGNESLKIVLAAENAAVAPGLQTV